MSAQDIKIEDERIEDMKIWPKPNSIRDIQVLLDIANFYKRFIRNFNRIVAFNILIL